MTPQVIDRKYVLTKHSLVTFQFRRIEGLALDGFNHQNVLAGLIIKDMSDSQSEPPKFDVIMEGIFGVDARFKCRSVKVVSVGPFRSNRISFQLTTCQKRLQANSK